MKIVIDIPEEIYDFVQNTSFVEDESTLFKQSNAERQKTLVLFDIIDAIRNGTPLPKEHGNLIDRDELKSKIMYAEDKAYETWDELYDCVLEDIENAPTIIEAEEGSDSE